MQILEEEGYLGWICHQRNRQTLGEEVLYRESALKLRNT